MGTVFSVAVTIMILGFLWFFVARPILEDYGVIAPRAVNDYQLTIELAPPVMSRQENRTERTNERSSHDQAWRDFLLDRTRGRLITVMVDSDLTVSEIRSLLKGESTVLGQEIEATRQRLGKASAQPYRTPIVGRPTRAVFEQDPELAYEPPE